MAPKNHRLASEAALAAQQIEERHYTIADIVLAAQWLALRQLQLGQQREVAPYLTAIVETLIVNEEGGPNFLQETEILRLNAAVRAQPRLPRTGSNLRYTSDENRFFSDLELSMKALREAQNRYSSQPSIDDYDRQLATAEAWFAVASAFYRSYAPERRVDTFREELPYQTSGIPVSVPCDVDVKVNFSFPQSKVGQNGAVLMGYHLDEAGRVIGERVLAEVPQEKFGETALRQLGRGRANVEGVHRECLNNRRMTVEFFTKP
jgi:hypothetical protein